MSRETEATSAASPVRPDYRRATVLACILVGLLTIVSMLSPPALPWDPGMGMLAWRSLENGGPFNTVTEPDPADISRDRARFLAWWSPGQYLIPGGFTLLGFRLGSALTITTGVSLLCCLLGWIRVAKHFALRPQTATLLVVFMSTFRYSTTSFGTYSGGEILLQGVTPWLILAGCRVPAVTAVRAAWLAGIVVLIGFLAKLTGVIVAGASLIAGSAAAYRRLRRISSGMVAGAVGAIAVCGLLFIVWFSRGTTPGSGHGWFLARRATIFAFSAPWVAGVSWEDLLGSFLPELQRPSTIIWFLLPASFLAAMILWGWRRYADDANLSGLLTITTLFYVVQSSALVAIYLRGGEVSIEERHFRSAGTLIFVCALAVAEALPRRATARFATLTFFGLMSIYGAVLMVNDARSARQKNVDPYSRTRQDDIDIRAIEFAPIPHLRATGGTIFLYSVSQALPVRSRLAPEFWLLSSSSNLNRP